MIDELKLEDYIGLPKCQDCGWKLSSPIVANCPCRGHGSLTKHVEEIGKARKLQRENQTHGR